MNDLLHSIMTDATKQFKEFLSNFIHSSKIFKNMLMLNPNCCQEV